MSSNVMSQRDLETLPKPGSNGEFSQDVGVPPRLTDEPIHYFAPPLPYDFDGSDHADVLDLLRRLQPLLEGSSLLWLWHVVYCYYTRARQAWRQYCITWRETKREIDEVRAGHDEAIHEAEAVAQATRRSLDGVESRFSEAASAKALVVSDTTPEGVRRAVSDRVLTEDETAGESGIGPVPAGSTSGHRFDAVGLFGGFVSGMLMSVAIGVVTGLLSLRDFEGGEFSLRLVFVLLIGPATAALLGGALAAIIRPLGEVWEPTGGLSFPRHRARTFLMVILAIMLLAWVAEVTVEAFALCELHAQKLNREQMLNPTSDGELHPFIVYVTIGLIVSTPYFLYKTAKAWKREIGLLRWARLRYLRRQRIDALLKDTDVQAALALACQVVAMKRRQSVANSELQRLRSERDAEIARMQVRRDDQLQRPYAAAIGLATNMTGLITDLIERADRELRKSKRSLPDDLQIVPD